MPAPNMIFARSSGSDRAGHKQVDAPETLNTWPVLPTTDERVANRQTPHQEERLGHGEFTHTDFSGDCATNVGERESGRVQPKEQPGLMLLLNVSQALTPS